MTEAVAVIRDVVIIVGGIVVMVTVMVVGMAIMDFVRKAEDLRMDVQTGVVNPIRGGLLAIRRILWWR